MKRFFRERKNSFSSKSRHSVSPSAPPESPKDSEAPLFARFATVHRRPSQDGPQKPVVSAPMQLSSRASRTSITRSIRSSGEGGRSQDRTSKLLKKKPSTRQEQKQEPELKVLASPPARSSSRPPPTVPTLSNVPLESHYLDTAAVLHPQQSQSSSNERDERSADFAGRRDSVFAGHSPQVDSKRLTRTESSTSLSSESSATSSRSPSPRRRLVVRNADPEADLEASYSAGQSLADVSRAINGSVLSPQAHAERPLSVPEALQYAYHGLLDGTGFELPADTSTGAGTRGEIVPRREGTTTLLSAPSPYKIAASSSPPSSHVRSSPLNGAPAYEKSKERQPVPPGPPAALLQSSPSINRKKYSPMAAFGLPVPQSTTHSVAATPTNISNGTEPKQAPLLNVASTRPPPNTDKSAAEVRATPSPPVVPSTSPPPRYSPPKPPRPPEKEDPGMTREPVTIPDQGRERGGKQSEGRHDVPVEQYGDFDRYPKPRRSDSTTQAQRSRKDSRSRRPVQDPSTVPSPTSAPAPAYERTASPRERIANSASPGSSYTQHYAQYQSQPAYQPHPQHQAQAQPQYYAQPQYQAQSPYQAQLQYQVQTQHQSQPQYQPQPYHLPQPQTQPQPPQSPTRYVPSRQNSSASVATQASAMRRPLIFQAMETTSEIQDNVEMVPGIVGMIGSASVHAKTEEGYHAYAYSNGTQGGYNGESSHAHQNANPYPGRQASVSKPLPGPRRGQAEMNGNANLDTQTVKKRHSKLHKAPSQSKIDPVRAMMHAMEKRHAETVPPPSNGLPPEGEYSRRHSVLVRKHSAPVVPQVDPRRLSQVANPQAQAQMDWQNQNHGFNLPPGREMGPRESVVRRGRDGVRHLTEKQREMLHRASYVGEVNPQRPQVVVPRGRPAIYQPTPAQAQVEHVQRIDQPLPPMQPQAGYVARIDQPLPPPPPPPHDYIEQRPISYVSVREDTRVEMPIPQPQTQSPVSQPYYSQPQSPQSLDSGPYTPYSPNQGPHTPHSHNSGPHTPDAPPKYSTPPEPHVDVPSPPEPDLPEYQYIVQERPQSTYQPETPSVPVPILDEAAQAFPEARNGFPPAQVPFPASPEEPSPPQPRRSTKKRRDRMRSEPADEQDYTSDTKRRGRSAAPTFYPLVRHLQESTLLECLLDYLSFYEWTILCKVSKQVRHTLWVTGREETLQRYLRTVGYTKWLWQDQEPLVLSVQDLCEYMRGVSIPSYKYAQIANSHLQSPGQTNPQTLHELVRSCRAFTRVVLRLRCQAEAEAAHNARLTLYQTPSMASLPSQGRGPSKNPYRGDSFSRASSRAPSPSSSYSQLPPSRTQTISSSRQRGGRGSHNSFQSPLFRLRRAPLLQVFVPSPEGDWLSDASVLECEAELKRAGVTHMLRAGDVIWDVAAGDEGNVGRLVWDGNYLIDLDYTYSRIGDPPRYLPSLAFPPSYFHRIIRTLGSGNPVVRIDVSPWAEDILSNVRLLQDKIRMETPQGGFHNVVRWVHRSSFTIRASRGSKSIRLSMPHTAGPGPSPTGAWVIDPDWFGNVVVEIEGTNEGKEDLQTRCRPFTTGRSRPDPEVEDSRKVWRILRERSRPGEIWIRAVSRKERLISA